MKRLPQVVREVKALRVRFGAPASQFARVVGVTPQSWHRKETGDTPIRGEELAKLARFYRIPMSEAFPSYEPTEGERILSEELQGAA